MPDISGGFTAYTSPHSAEERARRLQSLSRHATITNACQQEAPLSDFDPIQFRPRDVPGRSAAGGASSAQSTVSASPQVCFNRLELNEILAVYGRKVAAGEWRDYAIDMGREKAVFSIYRRTSEFPLYRVEKNPKLARKQGAYSVVTATGLILKRGTELRRVLGVLEKSVKLVDH
jgi:hypothetical protein